MDCSKFEESGLLYVAGELGESEARTYESHIARCEECRRETEEYQRERATLYNADTLGEVPSAAVDAEILRVCSNPKNMRTATVMPMMFVKKYAPVTVFLMLIMVAVGGYVSYHKMSAEALRASLNSETQAAKTLASSEPEQGTPGSEQNPAMKDSLNDITAPRMKGIPHNAEGVVTVKESRELP